MKTNLKTVVRGNLDAPLHQLLGEAPPPGLVAHRYDAALQDPVHLERVEKIQVMAHGVKNREDLVVFLV